MSKKAKKVAKKAERAEHAATRTAARHRHTMPVRIAGLLAEVADQPQLIATSVGTIAVGLATRRRDLVRGGTRMLAAHLLATAAKSAVKHRIDRTRPAKALTDGRRRFALGGSHDHDQNAFPSGHTAGAVAVARAAAREIDGAAAPAAAGVGAVAAIQPLAGNHYLSDVLVGGAIGWVAEALVDAVFDRIAPRDTAGSEEKTAAPPAVLPLGHQSM